MALEDAWVLAAELDRAADPAAGLAAYAAARRPRATRVQRAAARNGRIFHLAPRVARAGAGGARRRLARWRRGGWPAASTGSTAAT